MTRVMSMERERARLEGVIGRATADAAKAENGITESRLQINQLKQKFRKKSPPAEIETGRRSRI